MVIRMNIAVIGAGVMGSIYGGKLSNHNNVYMIDVNKPLLNHIKTKGITLLEDGTENQYFPKVTLPKDEKIDLIILFVKSMFSVAALEENKHLIGKDTYLLTLQNGAGHEDILEGYVPKDRIIIGTTEDNGALVDIGVVRRGGKGITNIGMLTTNGLEFLQEIKTAFDSCGFNTIIHNNIKQLIWNKLIMNSSLSATTGVLKCKIGFLAENDNAKNMVLSLLEESCYVARELGLTADPAEFLKKIQFTTTNSPQGITSISADMTHGRKTEVDTITGAVVAAAGKLGIKTPTHQFLLDTIHAMESINDNNNDK